MQKYGTADDAGVPIMDLETDFPGLHYLSADGLSAWGAPKNVYFETYAESPETRVYVPDTVCYDSVDISMAFAFTGDNRRDIYDDFCEYVSQGRIRYWDTARDREVCMVLAGAVEPEDDILKGSTPFILARFTFRNLYGRSFPVGESPR